MAEKQKKAPQILLPLAILFLVAIAAVVVAGIIKNKPKIGNILPNANQILGQEIVTSPAITLTPFIQTIIANTLENTKDTATQIATEKIIEVKNSVIETVNKEVTKLSTSQVEALKYQICRDWGVTTISPTSNP